MSQELRKTALELDRLANRIQEHQDIHRAASIPTIIACMQNNLRMDNLLSRIIDEYDQDLERKGVKDGKK
jgi:hypothetical protein